MLELNALDLYMSLFVKKDCIWSPVMSNAFILICFAWHLQYSDDKNGIRLLSTEELFSLALFCPVIGPHASIELCKILYKIRNESDSSEIFKKWLECQRFSFTMKTVHKGSFVLDTKLIYILYMQGPEAQSDTCPTGSLCGTDVPVRHHFFVAIDREIRWSFSPFRWFKKGSCQLLAKEWALSIS